MVEYNRNGYNPEEREAITDYLRMLDKVATVESVSHGLNHIKRLFGKLDLQDIESMFRNGDCKTHLVAFPVDEKSDYEAHSLENPRRKMPYYLLILVGEQERVDTKLAEIGSNPEENFRRLAETGVQVPRQGSVTSMMQKSRWN